MADIRHIGNVIRIQYGLHHIHDCAPCFLVDRFDKLGPLFGGFCNGFNEFFIEELEFERFCHHFSNWAPSASCLPAYGDKWAKRGCFGPKELPLENGEF